MNKHFLYLCFRMTQVSEEELPPWADEPLRQQWQVLFQSVGTPHLQPLR